MNREQLKQTRTFTPERATVRIDQANEEYRRAYAALEPKDQERVNNALGRLTYYVRNMGINGACELLTKMGWFISSGGQRGKG